MCFGWVSRNDSIISGWLVVMRRQAQASKWDRPPELKGHWLTSKQHRSYCFLFAHWILSWLWGSCYLWKKVAFSVEEILLSCYWSYRVRLPINQRLVILGWVSRNYSNISGWLQVMRQQAQAAKCDGPCKKVWKTAEQEYVIMKLTISLPSHIF